MSRSPKGTIQRAATIAEYAQDLDNAYRAADEVGFNATETVDIDTQDGEITVQYLQLLLKTITGQTLDPDDNFFVQGLDSLQALMLSRELRRLFYLPHLEARMLYIHPTISQLVPALKNSANGSIAGVLSPVENVSARNTRSIVETYSSLIDSIAKSASKGTVKPTAEVYLLTGSTGSLGSYLLDGLTKSGTARVYCLNRSSDSSTLQREKLNAWPYHRFLE